MVTVVTPRSVRVARRPDEVTAGAPRLAVAGLVVGAWALLPPYTGPPLATSTRVEVADHVVPGLVLLAVVVVVLAAGRRRHPGALLMLVAGLVVALAGLWMIFTHLPLVAQALDGAVPWGATLYHSAPGLAVGGLGFVWARRYWSEAG